MYDEIADEPPSTTNDIEFSTCAPATDLVTTESHVEEDEYLEPVQNQDAKHAEHVDDAGGEYSPLMEEIPSDHLYTKPGHVLCILSTISNPEGWVPIFLARLVKIFIAESVHWESISIEIDCLNKITLIKESI